MSKDSEAQILKALKVLEDIGSSLEGFEMRLSERLDSITELTKEARESPERIERSIDRSIDLAGRAERKLLSCSPGPLVSAYPTQQKFMACHSVSGGYKQR